MRPEGALAPVGRLVSSVEPAPGLRRAGTVHGAGPVAAGTPHIAWRCIESRIREPEHPRWPPYLRERVRMEPRQPSGRESQAIRTTQMPPEHLPCQRVTATPKSVAPNFRLRV